MKKFSKKQIIATIMAVIFIVAFVLMGVPEKLGRLAVITKDIATNMINATHGDPRPLEEMTTAYIKANTGTTKDIDYKYLPEALKPFKEHVHSPFRMGACAVCHAPNRSKPAAIVTHTVSELCYKCHTPVDGIKPNGKELDCNKCHSPHHADKEKLIRNTVTEITCPAGKFDAETTLPEIKHSSH
ncbi:cytochrome c3 family protein [Sulfurimonas sp.]|uniref:cytochrome c3 family protein n=1 Tax=Sulfurimonas sp. TaxID=2022749 RepID=UPI0025E03FB0|nr:cytochrome c3 family protein [Sulfurimonas sp.]MDD5157167.1 cytochrome c3 family protein [Sulfurimonas sp.]